MTAVAAPPTQRINFSLSADRQWGNSVSTIGDGSLYLDHWTFGPGGPSVTSEPLPKGLSCAGPTLALGPRSSLILNPTNAGFVVHRLHCGELSTGGIIPTQRCRIWPSDGSGALALVVTSPWGPHQGALWIIDPNLETSKVADVADPWLYGGGWLDPERQWFAINSRAADGSVSAAAINLHGGSVVPIQPEITDGRVAVQCTDPDRYRALVVGDGPRGPQMFIRTGSPVSGSTTHPLTIDRSSESDCQTLLPMDFLDHGRILAVQVRRGMKSDISLIDTDNWQAEEISLPLGWPVGHLRLADRVVGGCAVDLVMGRIGRPVGFVRCPAEATTDGAPGPTGRLLQTPTPAGAIESIVRGPDLTSARHIVVALHGGPAGAWLPTHDPFLDDLGSRAVAVVCPNIRGSIYYGAAHQEAIRNDWGGPDLDDVACIAEHLSQINASARLSLVGFSYGAYLALLAVVSRPHRWDRCLAVSAFSSPRSLADVAEQHVVDQLSTDGAFHPDDERDVVRIARQKQHCRSTPVLLVHGVDDPVVPISQARLLRDGLHDGACEAVRLLAVDGGGHAPLSAGSSPALRTAMEFLA